MKRKTLTTALLAGLAGAAGIANIADAVNQNPHGLGQVLIYPYYTTRGGTQGVNDYNTVISIVNTTDQAKAIKIRFLEALNSREVLDFNLYMSPFDVWTATVSDNGTGSQLSTNDNSCTVPSVQAFGPVAFSTLLFTEAWAPSGLDRTREGYVEAIEMGVLTGAAAAAARHIDTDGDTYADTPRNCDMLAARWTPPPLGGAGSCAGPLIFAGNIACWQDQDPFFELTPPTGGLFGGGQLLNVNDGADYGYNAVAFGDFSDSIQHTNPGFTTPTLASGNSSSWVADYEFSGTTNPVVHANAWSNGYRAFGATIMVDTVMNEYAVETDLEGGTDWVINFPTKSFHIGGALAPFTDRVARPTDTDDLCEEFSFFFWDREEAFPTPGVGGVPFSPFDPEDPQGLPKFCAEVNVLSFCGRNAGCPGQGEAATLVNTSNVLYATPKTGAGFGDGTRIDFNVTSFTLLPGDPDFDAGWARIDFNSNFTNIPGFSPPTVPLHRMVSLQVGQQSGYEGLPTVGFAVRRAVNGQLNVGGVNVLSNYGVLFEHATVQDISFVSE